MRKSINFAIAILVIVCSTALAQNDCREPQIGAIRWDAWYGSVDNVGVAVTDSLGTEHWKKRWPLFYTEEHGAPTFNESAQGTIESENRLAGAAGLRYWAFVFYGRSSPMGRALNQYLSGAAYGMRFALIIEPHRLGDGGDAIRVEICDLLKDFRYLQDANGRHPLFVLLSRSDTPGLGVEVAKLTRTCGGAAPSPAGTPLLVTMTSDLEYAKDAAEQLGGPVSAYAHQGGGKDAPYRELAHVAEAFWDQQFRSTGRGVIPLIMTGWDPRPRIEHPVPWISYPNNVYYEPPTPAELTEHLRHGINWVRQHPSGGCLALIYAWNEFDEGGWLAPTIGDGASRLDAVHQATR